MAFNISSVSASTSTRNQMPISRHRDSFFPKAGHSIDSGPIASATISSSTLASAEEPTPLNGDGTLGIDLGVTNIAVDSDGTTCSGTLIKGVRSRHRHVRTKLQKKSTLGTQHLVRTLPGQERRLAIHTNHHKKASTFNTTNM